METIISKNNKIVKIDKKGKRGVGSTDNLLNIIIKFLDKKEDVKILVLIPNWKNLLYLKYLMSEKLKNIKYNRYYNPHELDLDEWRENIQQLHPIGFYNQYNTEIQLYNNKKILFKTFSTIGKNAPCVRGLSIDCLVVMDITISSEKILLNDGILENVLASTSNKGKIFLEYENLGNHNDNK